jgi:hypothetical protein
MEQNESDTYAGKQVGIPPTSGYRLISYQTKPIVIKLFTTVIYERS